jgi:uncharacterized membrane protein (DUF2068 family)
MYRSRPALAICARAALDTVLARHQAERVPNAESMSQRVSDDAAAVSSDAAVRAIVIYKFIRGGVSVVAGVVLSVFVASGGGQKLRDLAHMLREHWTSGVAGHVSALLVHALDGRRAWLAVVGLALEGGVTLLEGFALQRGHRWGYWLVVGVAAVFVPFELVAWVHKPTVGRLLILIANVLVAAYLAWRVLREQGGSRRAYGIDAERPVGADVRHDGRADAQEHGHQHDRC